jgi:hypothetical protein
MSNAFFLSVIATILAATSLSINIYLLSQNQQLRRDVLRTRLLSRMTECSFVIRRVMQDLNQYEGFSSIAFGNDPANIPDLDATLAKIERLKAGFSDYSQDTRLEKLLEATDHIEKILALMQNVAAKSPGAAASNG